MLLHWLSPYRDIGLLLLRAGIGAMMILHGWPKLIAGPEKWEALGRAMEHLGIHFLPAFWGFACAATETIGGALLILGFCFRPVSLLLTFNFIVAAVMLHRTGSDFIGWSRPVEMAILFLGLTIVGAGRHSVDRG